MYDTEDDDDEEERRPNASGTAIPNDGATPATSADIRVLVDFLSQLQTPKSAMPMPSSDQAPRFKGSNLRSFLEDYNMVADSAGWTGRQKCEHVFMYCNRETRELVRKLKPRERGNWIGTMQMLHQLYLADDRNDKYTRDNLDHFVRKKRSMTSKGEFVEYYRKFSKRLHGLREDITIEDRDRLFWKGLPQDIRKDIYLELIAENPKLDRRRAASIEIVQKHALAILDMNSLYADLTTSRGNQKRKKDRSGYAKKKRSKSSKLFYDNMDSETSSSEEIRHRHRRVHSDSSDDEDSTLDTDTSSSDSSEDEKFKRSRRHQKKKNSEQRERPNKNTQELEMLNARSGKEQKPSKSGLGGLSDEFRRMKLMFGEANNLKEDNDDIPRDLKVHDEPSNRQIAQLVERVAREVQENRNDTQILLDQRRYGGRTGQTGRCFVCHLSDTHAFGSTNCPDAQALVRDGYCKFSNGRMYMADGGDLPKVGPGESVAALIRNASVGKVKRTGANRIEVTGTRAPRISYAHIVDEEVSETDQYESEFEVLEATPVMWHHGFAADRTEVPNKRFDPIDRSKRGQWKNEQREARTNAPRPTPYVELPPVPKQWGPVRKPFSEAQNRPTPTVPNEKKTSNAPREQVKEDVQAPPKILKAPRNYPANPVPAKEAKHQEPPPILKDQPNIKKSDFVLRDDPRIPNPGPEKILPRSPAKSRFTTNMRQKYSSQEIYQKLLGTDVTLPLGELLSVCPDIEKNLANETKLRTVPITHVNMNDRDNEAADALAVEYQVETTSETDEQAEGETNRYGWRFDVDEGNQEIPSGMTARAIERSPKRIQAVSSTGSFVVQLGNHEVVAMVDSGAEMNMITPRIADGLRDRYPEDESGRRLHMKNVSGVVSPLNGRFNDIPVIIGGQCLRQTFFVGDQWDSHFEVILGQTFLRDYACEMSWNGPDHDHIAMRIYPSGDKRDDAIVARLTKQLRGEATVRVQFAELHHSKNLGTDQEEVDESDEDSYASCEDQSEPDRTNSSDDEARSKNYDSSSENDSSLPNDHVARKMARREKATTFQNKEARALNDRFNKVVNRNQQIGVSQTDPLCLVNTQAAYRKKHYKQVYLIPIGNQLLNMGNGDHTIKINGQAFTTLFAPKMNFNLITQRAQQLAGLEPQEIAYTTNEGDDPPRRAKIEFCANVPIMLSVGPIMPGIFLLRNNSVSERYDIILGKPWMVGIEQFYKDYQFNDPSKSETSEDEAMDVDASPSNDEQWLDGAKTFDEKEIQVRKIMGDPIEASNGKIKEEETKQMEQKSVRENPEQVEQEEGPSLGGSAAKML